MIRYEGDEKRAAARMSLTTFCPVVFEYRQTQLHALMTDLSERGARLRLEDHAKDCPVGVGECLALQVKTPYGMSKCEGRVVWLSHIDGHLHLGLDLFGLSGDAKDPLLCFIDSLF